MNTSRCYAKKRRYRGKRVKMVKVFGVVTRYDDIIEVEKNPHIFSSQTNISPDDRPEETLESITC